MVLRLRSVLARYTIVRKSSIELVISHKAKQSNNFLLIRTYFPSFGYIGSGNNALAIAHVRHRDNGIIKRLHSSNIVPAGGRKQIARLRIHGPDRHGIVASFSSLLYDHGCNIIQNTSEQSTDGSSQLWFQRIVFHHSNDNVENRAAIEHAICDLCTRVGMTSILRWVEDDEKNKKLRMAIFVGRRDHCLWELLLRQKAGELDCEIACVVSNHSTCEHVAQTFGIPYHYFPLTSKKDKRRVEEQQVRLLKTSYGVDLIVLARYMQVLSEEFLKEWPMDRIINIHHSFLPAFVGGKPYHRAHERGVKLIGATAHYATMDLDEGPIIEQDTKRISHRDTVNDLIRKGRTLEKNVLVNAVKAHLDDRVILYKNKCIVFDD